MVPLQGRKLFESWDWYTGAGARYHYRQGIPRYCPNIGLRT